MKTLNDTLREEFRNSLKNNDLDDVIKKEDLNPKLLEKAFDVLLKFKTDKEKIEIARSEFENFLINYLKANKD
jgi:hypothetical protein